jgi:UDP-xylose/UDP-N-acetylglucosamine transporter B4
MQVLSVVILTVGVIVAAMGDSPSKSTSTSFPVFLQGLALLFIAQVLSAIMGIYVQNTYETYGSHWRENLFYSHAISLLFFAPFYPQMKRQFESLKHSEPLYIPQGLLPRAIGQKLQIPRQLGNLAINTLTQYACIRGVNLLGARASALTVTIVLNIRKLVSLLISVWLFGNKLSPGVLLGASLVFGAGAAYAIESSRLSRQRSKLKKG